MTFSSGVATFSGLSYDKAETMNITFSTNASGVSDPTSRNAAVSPAAASKLVYATQPTSTTAGVAINPAVVVDVEDAYNNIVTTNSSTVTLTLSSGTFSSGSSTATAAASAGAATFGSLAINKAGSYTLAGTDGTLTATGNSSSITISPAAASQLVITQQPSATATFGQAFSTQPIVAEEDPYGNVITTDSTNTVTAARGSQGTSNLQGTTTLTLSSGVATFSGLSYNSLETMNIAFSTTAGIFTATSNAVSVVPG